MIFPAILESVKSRKDKTLAVTLGTQELSPEQASQLMGFNQQFLYVMFKADIINNKEQELMEELQLSATDESKQKTDSQRMRSVLYLLWKQQPEGYTDFNLFYSFKMNKFIDALKAKLQ